MKYYLIFIIIICLTIVFYSVDAGRVSDIVVGDNPLIKDAAMIEFKDQVFHSPGTIVTSSGPVN